MAANCRDAHRDGPEDGIAWTLDARRQEQHWECALRRVGEEDDDTDLPAQHPEHIRRAEVARTLLAEVHALRSAGEVREGNGSREERQRERDGGMHDYTSAFAPLLRRMRMRSGFPVKGYVSRKPLCRKRT